MTSTTVRRGALALAAAGAATAAIVAFPSSASAADGYVEVGPGRGIQCVGDFGAFGASGFGFVTSGTGANFQLRFNGSQIAGSGAQVASYASPLVSRGFGYYEFCARNNGSYATAFISVNPR